MEVVTYRPNRVVGLVVGGVGLALLLGLDLVFLLLLPQPPLGILNFVWGFLFLLTLPPIGLLAYRTYNVWQAAYRLGLDRLIIDWGARREIIPLRDIQEALPGREIERDLRPGGLWWPGCIVGRQADERLGQIEFLATLPQDSQVFVATIHGAFALSPEALEEFTAALNEALEARIEAGSSPLEAEAAEEGAGPAQRESFQPAFKTWPLWQDRWALGLTAGAAVAVLVLFAFVLWQLPSLPMTVPLHFAADGAPDRTGAPRGLLQLPFIGLLTLAVNSVFGGLLYLRARQPVAAYMLWGCAALVQALVWVATLGLIARA